MTNAKIQPPVGKGFYVCKNGVQKKKPARRSNRQDCPWRVHASQSKKDKLWRAKLRNGEHNHDKPSNTLYYHANRSIKDPQARAAIMEMTEDMLTPAQIERRLKSDVDGAAVIRKDIYNRRSNLARAQSSGHEALDLHDFLLARGYVSRYHVNNNDTTVSMLFATHPVCIERARRFSEVVIMDATYKTSLTKLPMVNIVGIHNIGSMYKSTSSLQSFYIGSAFVSNEKEVSYTWVLEQLKDVIFNSSSPGIFVTDDDKALGAALRTVFPDTPQTLCMWHIKKNFEAHASGCFKHDSEQRKEHDSIVGTMVTCRTMKEFDDSIEAYRQLVSTTKKSRELKSYIDGYAAKDTRAYIA